jgi:hypothetical protein
MKRRSFMKKSVAAAIIAASPIALTGLVNAEGGGEGSGTDTTWFTTAENTLTTIIPDLDACDADMEMRRWIYLNNTCYLIVGRADQAPDEFGECVAYGINCTVVALGGAVAGIPLANAGCELLRQEYQNEEGEDMLGPGYLNSFSCSMI